MIVVAVGLAILSITTTLNASPNPSEATTATMNCGC